VAGVTRGDVARLRTFSERMLARVDASEATRAEYAAAMARLHAAPSDLPVGVPDRSATIADDLATLRVLDRQPARFAAALLLADRAAGGAGWLTALLGRWWAALRSGAALRAEARAAELHDELAALLADGRPLERRYDAVATLLAALDDPALAAAFYERLRPEQLFALLELVHEAQQVKADPTAPGNAWIAGREPMTDLLAPLGRSFADAAALGAISPAFVERLFASPPPGPYGWPSTTLLLSQLLVYGDPMGAGDPHVTSAFASMVLGDGFLDATRTLHGVASVYVDPDRPDVFAGMFHVEHLVHHAAASLAADPEASFLFLVEPRNPAALLDRAAEGWAMGEGTVSEILAGGLLLHPRVLGVFDRGFDARHPDTVAYLAAVRRLVDDVAGRGSVPASAAEGLGIVLAPHHASLRARFDDALDPDVLGLDADTYRRYLANVVAHDTGLAAVEQVFAGWTAAVYAGWAQELSTSSHLDAVPTAFMFDTRGLVDTWRLLEQALHDANVHHAERNALLLTAIDRAGGMARSQVLRRAGLPGGPVSFVAGEAASWVTRQGTGWAKDRILDAGPMDVSDFRSALAETLPQLAVGVLIDAVPEDRLEELVPVLPGPREWTTERDATVWERLTFWSQPDLTVTEVVEFQRWPAEVLDGWRLENLEAYDELPAGADRRDWWLNVIVSDVRKGVWEGPR
jgi:hypothetical protein